jgi:hypothetical protein
VTIFIRFRIFLCKVWIWTLSSFGGGKISFCPVPRQYVSFPHSASALFDFQTDLSSSSYLFNVRQSYPYHIGLLVELTTVNGKGKGLELRIVDFVSSFHCRVGDIAQ